MLIHNHICCRCGGSWRSKLARPKQCPMCKQPKWDVPARSKKMAPENKSSGPRICVCQHCNYFWTPRVPRPHQCPNCKTIAWEKQRSKSADKRAGKKFHLVRVKDSEVLPMMARFYVGGGYTKNPEKAKLYSKETARSARLINGVPWCDELFLVRASEVAKLKRPDGMVLRSDLLKFYLSPLNDGLLSRKNI